MLANYAATIAVLGLAGVHNATENSIAQNLWFRLENNFDLLFETDDGSNDSDDNDTGVKLVQDTFAIVACDMTDLQDIRVYVNGTRRLPGTRFHAGSLSVSTPLQPYLNLNRASGALLTDIHLDYFLYAQGGR